MLVFQDGAIEKASHLALEIWKYVQGGAVDGSGCHIE